MTNLPAIPNSIGAITSFNSAISQQVRKAVPILFSALIFKGLRFMINLWQFKNFKNSITFINNQNLIAEAEVTEYWKARKDIDDFLSNHFYIMMGIIQEDQTHPLFWIVNTKEYKNISFNAINSHQQKLNNYLEKYVIILDNITNYLSFKANNKRISQEINKNINPLIDFLDNNLENFDSIKLPTNNQNTIKNFASDIQGEEFKEAREYYNNNKIIAIKIWIATAKLLSFSSIFPKVELEHKVKNIEIKLKKIVNVEKEKFKETFAEPTRAIKDELKKEIKINYSILTLFHKLGVFKEIEEIDKLLSPDRWQEQTPNLKNFIAELDKIRDKSTRGIETIEIFFESLIANNDEQNHSKVAGDSDDYCAIS